MLMSCQARVSRISLPSSGASGRATCTTSAGASCASDARTVRILCAAQGTRGCRKSDRVQARAPPRTIPRVRGVCNGSTDCADFASQAACGGHAPAVGLCTYSQCMPGPRTGQQGGSMDEPITERERRFSVQLDDDEVRVMRRAQAVGMKRPAAMDLWLRHGRAALEQAIAGFEALESVPA